MPRLYCPRCETVTEHTHISEGKVFICSVYGCGHEIRTKQKGEPMYTKLNEREEAALRGDWAALPENERNAAKVKELAKKYGVSAATVSRKVKEPSAGGDAPTRVKRARRTGRPKGPARKAAAPANFSLRALIEQRVAELVDARLAALDLDAKIEAALGRLLK
jgi:transposase